MIVTAPLPVSVSPSWLRERLGSVVVLDASWHMPDSGRSAAQEFAAGHIPGAQRFDIEAVSDPQSPLPHTMPSAEAFARALGAVGISNDTEVVVYEAGPVFAAPRVIWMFRAMGHEAKLLEGGLAAWRQEGLEVEEGPPRPVGEGHFVPQDRGLFVDADTVAAALSEGGTVVDVRSPERFYGKVPEPREGLRSGHMPGAKNLHYAQLLTPQGTLKTDDELRSVLADNGVSTEGRVITSCGSGVTASILSLALARLGVDSAVYDGSWSEWGADPSRPVTTDPA